MLFVGALTGLWTAGASVPAESAGRFSAAWFLCLFVCGVCLCVRGREDALLFYLYLLSFYLFDLIPFLFFYGSFFLLRLFPPITRVPGNMTWLGSPSRKLKKPLWGKKGKHFNN